MQPYDANGREIRLPVLGFNEGMHLYKGPWAYVEDQGQFFTPAQGNLYISHYREYSSDMGPLRRYQVWAFVSHE